MILLAAFIALAHPAPPDPEYPEVRLEDAQRFGLTAGICRWMWVGIGRHQDQMRPVVHSNNPPPVAAMWDEDIRWRLRCYDKLDDVLFCQIPLKSKLKSLDELRRLLGDADYYGGRMPSPVPAYKWPAK